MPFWQSWGFDDCLYQVKASYPDLDLSNINIDAPAQMSVQPATSESTDELFVEDVPSDRETIQAEDNTRHPNVQEENEQDPPVQQQSFFILFYFI